MSQWVKIIFLSSIVTFYNVSAIVAQNSRRPPNFVYANTSAENTWCKLIKSKNRYVPVKVLANSNPDNKSPLWETEVRVQKSKVKKEIAVLKKRLKVANTLSIKIILLKRIAKLDSSIQKLDTVYKLKVKACNNVAARYFQNNNLPTPLPTDFPRSSPTPKVMIQEYVEILLNQHESKSILLKSDINQNIQLLVESNIPNDILNLISWNCNLESGSLSCSVNTGTYVGNTTTSYDLKESFSDDPNDYQITRLNITLRVRSDPSSFSGLEIPSAQQLVKQRIDDSGIGIRPWEKVSQGLLKYAQQGDATAATYKEHLQNLITRTTGTSALLKPLPAVNNLDSQYYYNLNLCRYLETNLIDSPILWHDLNSVGVPKSGGSSYLLRTYQPAEIRALVLNYMINALERYSQFSTWKDSNAEIGLSMLAIQFAEAYSCVRDEISEEQRLRFEQALRDKYITPTLLLLNTGGWPLGYQLTLDTGNQGIEVAAVFILANSILMKESPDSSAQNIVKALQSLSRFLNLLYQGGSLEEGPNYHTRSFDYLVRLDESLWRTFGTNFGLLSPNSAVANESSLWLYNTYGPGGYLFGFNDSTPNTDLINTQKQLPWSYGIGLYLANLFNDSIHAISEIGKLKADWPGDGQLLYYKPYDSAEILSRTPKDYKSSGFPLFASRSDHTQNALYIAAIGQIHGWIHNYKNPGTYVVHWNGVPFVDSLFSESYGVNVAFDSPTYWTQVARTYDLYRKSPLGSNSIILTDPQNVTSILTSGRPAGYESDSDPNVLFGQSKSEQSSSFAVLDMTRLFVNYNSNNYVTTSQQGWPLPSDRFVRQALRGYGLNRSVPTLPWAYVCDETQYSGTATTKIAFNTPASVSTLGVNRYRLTYQQPINSTGGTRTVAMNLFLQSSLPLTVNTESLSDLPSNPSRYPSWWPWSTPGYQCNVDSTQSNCFKQTHLPSMTRFSATTTGAGGSLCMIFVPETGVSFTPPAIANVSGWN